MTNQTQPFIFDADPQSPEYPELLREARINLKLTQAQLAEFAGHSTVMHGRYETERSKRSSAIPSDRKAAAIKRVLEQVALSGKPSMTNKPEPTPAPSFSPEDFTRELTLAIEKVKLLSGAKTVQLLY